MDYDLSYDLGYEGDVIASGATQSSRHPGLRSGIHDVAICDPHQEHPGYWCETPPLSRTDVRGAQDAAKQAQIEALRAQLGTLNTEPANETPEAKAQRLTQRAQVMGQLAALTGGGKGTGGKAAAKAAPPPPPRDPLPSSYVPRDKPNKILDKLTDKVEFAPSAAAPDATKVTYTADQLNKDQPELLTKLEDAFVAHPEYKDKPEDARAAAQAYYDYLKTKGEEAKSPNWAKEASDKLFKTQRIKVTAKPKEGGAAADKPAGATPAGGTPPANPPAAPEEPADESKPRFVTRTTLTQKPSQLLDGAIKDRTDKAADALADFNAGADVTAQEADKTAVAGQAKALHGDKSHQLLSGLMEREDSYRAYDQHRKGLKNNGTAMAVEGYQTYMDGQGLLSDKTVGSKKIPNPVSFDALQADELRPASVAKLEKFLTLPTDQGDKGMSKEEAALAMRYLRFRNPEGKPPSVGIDKATPAAIDAKLPSLKEKPTPQLLAELRANAVTDLGRELQRVHPGWSEADAHRFMADQGLLEPGTTLEELDQALTDVHSQEPLAKEDSEKQAVDLAARGSELSTRVGPEYRDTYNGALGQGSVDYSPEAIKQRVDQAVANSGLTGKAAEALRTRLTEQAESARDQAAAAEKERASRAEEAEKGRAHTTSERLGAEASRRADQEDAQAHDKEIKGMDFAMQTARDILKGAQDMVQAYANAFFQANMPKQYDAMLAQNVWLTVQGSRPPGR